MSGTPEKNVSMNANITADAVALQERDEFCEAGWLKLIAPAKVNLHLAIGERRSDGYHEAATVMHALMLRDVVYMKTATETTIRMVAGDPSIEVPELAPEDNIAMRAVARLAEKLDGSLPTSPIEMRIEKNIPAQGGLGGGSSDAAAALVGAASLWGIPADHPAIEETARELGADVAFFLHGPCAYLEGTGDTFVHVLKPSRQAVVLVKPDGGVSTAEAYRRFDDAPTLATAEQAERARTATNAQDVPPFNNLAPASEKIMPALADMRQWLEAQPQTRGTLLCGSGAATFALCDTLADATAIATQARQQGWWSRATSMSPIGLSIIARPEGAA